MADDDSNAFDFRMSNSVFWITFTCSLQPDAIAPLFSFLIFMLDVFDLTAWIWFKYCPLNYINYLKGLLERYTWLNDAFHRVFGFLHWVVYVKL